MADLSGLAATPGPRASSSTASQVVKDLTRDTSLDFKYQDDTGPRIFYLYDYRGERWRTPQLYPEAEVFRQTAEQEHKYQTSLLMQPFDTERKFIPAPPPPGGVWDPIKGFQGVFWLLPCCRAHMHYTEHHDDALRFLEERGLWVGAIFPLGYITFEPRIEPDGEKWDKPRITVTMVVMCPWPEPWYEPIVTQMRNIYFPADLFGRLVMVKGWKKDFHPEDAVEGLFKVSALPHDQVDAYMFTMKRDIRVRVEWE
ncbi:hypothetical protein H072_5813 [Dactylellina haptotyla CBS 200.50]|uniref:Uncharacterized protein n=1 Tax=Dactylellina haptotyla (strain CBS 200.50) TaxID=1284197 RepID=S8BLU1_DACHA|nr:hypothetical protein H072_5813 [Dactylellina haptotyla CBS 200.50]